MKKVNGTNVKVDKNDTGGMISVDWVCPYCGSENYGFYFSSKTHAMQGDFELDHECDECEKMVTIICRNAKKLF